MTDAGISRDADGNPTDAKELLKIDLIDNWDALKDFYNRFNEEQKERFESLTNIDDIDIEDDNTAAARTCIDSLVNEQAAQDLLDNLNQLYDDCIAMEEAGPESAQQVPVKPKKLTLEQVISLQHSDGFWPSHEKSQFTNFFVNGQTDDADARRALQAL